MLLDIYKGHRVYHDIQEKGLCLISFNDYEEAYNTMYSLNKDGYMIHDLEEVENEDRFIVWFT